MNKKFIKNGIVYWILPKPIPNSQSKKRPAIALFKYGYEKHVFLQLGTAKNNIPSDVYATNLLKKDIDFNSSTLKDSTLHLDISKPELKNAVIKPHSHKGGYLDIDLR